MDIQTLVQHAVLDNAIALPRRHGTSAQAVPSALNMALDPLLDRLDILLAVLEILSQIPLIRAQDIGLGLPIRLRQMAAPATVRDTSTQVARQCIRLGGRQIHIIRPRRRVVREEGVHVLHLAGIGIHPPRRLAGLDVAPHHGGHVALVVHEAGVEVGCLVRVGRLDVRAAAREGVLEEVEHGEELAGR